MKNIIGKYISITAFLISVLQGGIGDEGFSFILEGRSGLFRPTPENFVKIYGDNNLISGATLGIGYENTFLVARYKSFEAKGNSIVKGIDLEGVATWSQRFVSLGIRTYAQKLIYAELAYVMSSIKESISTNEPSYTALESSFSKEINEGVSVSLGINVPVAFGFHISGEAEYLYIQMPSPNQSNDEKINIGGPAYGLGISFVF